MKFSTCTSVIKMIKFIKNICLSFVIFQKIFFFNPIFAQIDDSIETKYKLCVCSIFQNESPYLKEWVDYNIKVGVEHFWLYNNNSIDDFNEVLKPYVKKGIVEIIDWPSFQNENDFLNFSYTVQIGAYNDALNKSRRLSKWLALIDTDEFIVPIHYDTVTELLENEFSNCSGLCINWQCYGTSHVEHAENGLLQDLLFKMRWNHEHNKYSKSIVQPLHVSHCPNPHFCIYNNNHWAIDSNHNPTPVCCNSINIDKIRINHYWTRDEWFFYNIKLPRHQRWGNNNEIIFKLASEMNEEYDPILSN